MQRAESSKVHNLLLDMPTHHTQVTLSVTENKVQLNRPTMLAGALLDPENSLIIADVTDVSVQLK